MTDETDIRLEGEPSIEGMLENFLDDHAEGWRDLDTDNLGEKVQKQLAAQKKEMRHEANLFREVFYDNPSGRKVLNILLNQTLRSTAWPVYEVQNAEMLQAMGIFREGQNAFVSAIVEAIALSENHDVQERSP